MSVSGYGQKCAHAYRVGGLVKVKAYARWHALLESLPIVQAEGKCGRNGTELKHGSNYFRKSENLMHSVFIL